ncbi:putative uncharacterized protein DDB_G0268338 [Octopus sinensis]|uniref:Uncharacterized protein n=1 Tax=Octopus sinensis TaxID=2607531 RepID=A0A6P7S702_9MOLL|nr:putative uncharacterized protein DDB_G0268338 [Octopus sinensis]
MTRKNDGGSSDNNNNNNDNVYKHNVLSHGSISKYRVICHFNNDDCGSGAAAINNHDTLYEPIISTSDYVTCICNGTSHCCKSNSVSRSSENNALNPDDTRIDSNINNVYEALNNQGKCFNFNNCDGSTLAGNNRNSG